MTLDSAASPSDGGSSDFALTDIVSSDVAPSDVALSGLPMPTGRRWQPLRLGLVDLFYYENEVFPFVDGRLLLRGNNGAGKSKVLALTLPFLLDGDLSAQRVEPDGDRQKRMEWNLLLGDEHPNNERLGYSWLEFGRVDENGEPQFITIGAGLKAARGRGITKHWFFTTQQRVGPQLQLIDDNRLVLGHDRLALALEDAGHVYDSKGEYRQAVDQTLFGLGERRYAELIELLLQIRAPQLSKKPSEAALSEALTRALTPVSDDVIKSVADGLRSLDEERDEVQQLASAQKAVHGFLGHYREYASVMLKRQAEGPRKEQAEHDRHGRAIIETTAERDRLQATLDALAVQLAALRTEQSGLEGEREALRDSVHADSERLLETADAAAQAAAERSDRAAESLGRAEGDLRHTTGEAEADRDRLAEAQERVRLAIAAASAAASESGVAHRHDLLADAATDHVDASLETDKQATAAEIARTREALNRVSALIDAVEKAEAALADAAGRDAEADSRYAEAVDQRGLADSAVDAAVDAYVSDVEIALAALTELSIPDAAFTDWVRVRTGENPAMVALRAHAQVVLAELHARRAAVQQRLDALDAQLSVLDTEIAGLEQGESVEPLLPATRAAAPAGSVPLWLAVSFRDQVDAASRAGLEAGLEASGLLTAVVLPDGSVQRAEDGQLVLHATDVATSARTLDDVLVAEPPAGSAVSVGMISAVLRSVALGEHEDDDPAAVWVSTTGRYRLGSAYGAWTSETARYVGESARAAARERRLRQARAERDVLLAEQATLRAELGAIAARVAIVDRETAAVPFPQELEAADRIALAAAAFVAQRERERDEARARHAVANDRRGVAEEELAADAAVLQLPTDAATIRVLGDRLSDYDRRAHEAWSQVTHRADAARALARTVARLVAAQEEHERAVGERDAAASEFGRNRAHADTLRAQLGADVKQYRDRVAEVAQRSAQIGKDVGRLGNQERKQSEQRAVLNERLSGIRLEQERTHAARVSAVDALRRTTALGLARVADLAIDEPDGQGEWAVTPGVQFARAIDAALTLVDASEDRYNRLLSQVHTEFTDLQRSLARHGHEAAYIPSDDGVRVVVTFSGREMLLVELAAQLGEQIAQHELLLNAKEREIIQAHLVTEVGAQLSELIGEADQQSVQLNSELRTRPTSTGMTLRVLWKPRADGPAGLADARRILATTADVWNDADRVALGAFLQARIAEVRDADEAGNWYDHLGEALDYRRWHRFTVERQQGGQWKPATGPASGGERVLAASIPLFAAASSHYRTAGNPYAPRLIMLDEAFAGVDDNSRASCLGLLAEFDLDVVMTSEREWGCYPEVPGLSIAQLTRFDGAGAVHVQRWRWDGRHRRAVAEPVAGAGAGAGAGAAADASAASGLW